MPTRRAFLKDSALAVIGTAVVPAFASYFSGTQTLDLHAHFAMHLRLPTTPRDNPAGDAFRALLFRTANLFFNNSWGRFRVTPDAIRKGGIAAMASVLYDPADEFRLGHAAPGNAFAHILEQIQQVEQAVEDNYGLELAHNVGEVEACLVKGQTVLFHCMEGSIGLGGDAGHVAELARRGVAYMIIAHLFYKGAATCNNSIPFLTDKQFAKMNAQPEGVGLTQHGCEVVEACFREGIIVDLTHCTDQAIDDIFRIHSSRGEYRDAPIISSHTGVRGTSNYAVNLSDETILRIRKTGGVVAIIPCVHLLTHPHAHSSKRIDLVFDAIDYVHRLTGSYDTVAIGSDLDGFALPVKDFKSMRDVPKVQDAFTKRYGAQVADAILRDNALRVLKQGWRAPALVAGSAWQR